MALFEGTNLPGRAINPEIGPDANGRPRVRWNMEVVDGEHKGKAANYSGKLDPENIKWTKRDMIAIGWKGVDVRTFVDDVKAANRVVPFTAEIAEFNGRSWTSAKMTGAAPLGQFDKDKAAEVNRWFAEAGDIAPQANGTSDRDIPF